MMMAVAASALCASCSKDAEVAEPQTPPITTSKAVKINLSNSTATRAFFDPSAAAESWEKKINSAMIVVERYSDPSGDADEIIHKTLTASDIANGSTTIELKGANVDDVIGVGIVVNIDLPDDVHAMSVYSDVLKNYDESAYNGTFQEVYNRAKRTEGFPMYGIGLAPVEDRDNIVIPVLIERSVAKIAVETTLSDNFKSSYAGDLRVDSFKIRTADFYDNNYENGQTHTQVPNKSGDKFQNLFYMAHSYHNECTLQATYDRDGDFTTTDDQTPVSYQFSICSDYGGEKEMRANHYYRVNLKINTLDEDAVGSESSLDVSVSVADWVSVEDQNVDIG